jgi:hypothetical protein
MSSSAVGAYGPTAYPVRLEARLEAPLSRWLWLVKWLLLIPHYVVLAFLFLALLAVTLAAFFAIVFTGRYPRGMFDFNIGVLRWAWRVGYYGYSALGTDRYPPFSLQRHDDYPATFDVDRPERLSRGLPLVKWLLAFPHWLVVAAILGSTTYVGDDVVRNPGLVGILVLIAAVGLLFTGRYLPGVYDLVVGLDRWVARVAAYVLLMTDAYPPFRLDQGGSERAT